MNLILRLSGFTQTQLAGRLGVTFAALNRWINGKAIPRRKAQAKINELLLEYSGQKEIPDTILEAKKGALSEKRKTHRNVVREIIENPDIRDQFYLSLTYNSNRIEGSTLSENETTAILFENAVIPNRSLVEQLEAKNHQAVLEYLFQHMAGGKVLNEELILRLHRILMNAIRSDAGSYRTHGARIMGTHVPTANYAKVPALMRRLVRDVNTGFPDAVAHIAETHSHFEQIHPFSDGNGRVGRLLMHAMALEVNLAPVVILQERRRLYTAYLNKAQMKNDLSLFEDFVCDAILEGYKILERQGV